ncbi:MAG: carbohydrate-binding family 9-like protein [bacterium]|nr:carbohydrate-binding family 9-like protein [Candidatus Sumerlaeota bacterium]
MKKVLLITLLAGGLAGTLFAQNTYTVQFTHQSIVVDGSGSDPAWAAAPFSTNNFVAHDTGVVSDQQTKFKALWNSANLYVYFETDDNGPLFDSNMTTNNATLTFTNDDMELFFDPFSSRNNEANPCNKYQITMYPETDGSGNAINQPMGYVWTAAGNSDFPGPGDGGWPSSDQVIVRFTTTAGVRYTGELQIPWMALDSPIVNMDGSTPAVIPPSNGNTWSFQPCRLHHPGSNNTDASKWNPSGAGFRTKPYGLWTFTGAASVADWTLF